jgi:hypothetical protein
VKSCARIFCCNLIPAFRYLAGAITNPRRDLSFHDRISLSPLESAAAWEAAQVQRSIWGGIAMEWFSQKTSIAGNQISNWVLVLAAVVVIWVIYSLAIR